MATRFSWHAVVLTLVTGCMSLCGACGAGPAKTSTSPPQTLDFFRMVDAIDNPLTFQYAYAPSIVLKDTCTTFFSAQAAIFSPLGITSAMWNRLTPDKLGLPQRTSCARPPLTMDLSACDPSVVNFQGFYYMFYGSAITTAPNVFQTVIQVTRSTNLAGPYFTYTQRCTWEDNLYGVYVYPP